MPGAVCVFWFWFFTWAELRQCICYHRCVCVCVCQCIAVLLVLYVCMCVYWLLSSSSSLAVLLVFPVIVVVQLPEFDTEGFVFRLSRQQKLIFMTINFDSSFVSLIKEARCMERLGIRIAGNIKELARDVCSDCM